MGHLFFHAQRLLPMSMVTLLLTGLRYHLVYRYPVMLHHMKPHVGKIMEPQQQVLLVIHIVTHCTTYCHLKISMTISNLIRVKTAMVTECLTAVKILTVMEFMIAARRLKILTKMVYAISIGVLCQLNDCICAEQLVCLAISTSMVTGIR